MLHFSIKTHCKFSIGKLRYIWYNNIIQQTNGDEIMKKIAIGLSGGVDSAAAAHILLQKGFDVTGIILRLKPENAADGDIDDAKKIADKLGIDLRVLDLRKYFSETVISSFISEYLAGRTPNPCIECNSLIKFGAMLDYALEIGCDGIATGHYARIEKSPDRYLLKRSATAKDQSYFLYKLTQNQLSKILFPLDGLEKDVIRQTALDAGLPVAQKRDSQEICFVPDDDYIAFLSAKGITSPEGNFTDKDGNILGRHSGIINYTVGQRKGLGAFGKPMFVNSICAKNNTVIIGENGTQYCRGLVADGMNYIAFEKPDGPFRAEVKIRFRAKEQPATVTPLEDGKAEIIFDEPQRSVTPGQGAVIYDGDTVIGGGRIIEQIN